MKSLNINIQDITDLPMPCLVRSQIYPKKTQGFNYPKNIRQQQHTQTL